MSNEPNTQANSAFDALPLATRSAIGAHVTKQLRAAGTSQKNFVSTFVAQCERITENPDAVATILAESKSAGIVM